VSQTQLLTPQGLLGLMWLASPALPVGGYSYSEGLEAAIDDGLVHDEASAQRCLLDQLGLSLTRSELPLLAQAHQAWNEAPELARITERITALNDWVLHTRESAETRQQTLQMGRSLALWLRQQHGETDPRVALLHALVPAPSWPVAFALAATMAQAPRDQSLLAFAFSWAENMVQAAVKAVPLGQSAGQRLLRALVQALPEAVAHALRTGDEGRRNFAPMLAIRSAQHETQYSRLFRS
jgi:urease accessory protein